MKRSLRLQCNAAIRFSANESGAALIVALLLTALGAAVAAQLIQPLAGWLAREYRARDTQAAYTLADAAATWSLTVLTGDARTSTIDHLGELWAISLPPTQVEGGTIDGRIVDLQAKFNLNNLAPNGLRSEPNVQVAKNIFARAGVPVALAERLVDAIDTDQITATGQSESQVYESRFANASIETLADLVAIGGFTAAHLDALAPYVDVLPNAVTINANTASPDLLAAALPSITSEQWAKAIAVRQSKPFASIAELSAALGTAVPDAAFSVASQHFEMRSTLTFERVTHKVTIRCRRPVGLPPSIYYRSVQNT
ncbi:MAG: type II secretion system minor pseudopilin GspK [Casimicrobium sp.]